MEKFSVLTIILLSGLASQAQTNEKIEKEYHNPQRSTNAAKADVHVTGNKKISDSTFVYQKTPLISKKKKSARKRCRKVE